MKKLATFFLMWLLIPINVFGQFRVITTAPSKGPVTDVFKGVTETLRMELQLPLRKTGPFEILRVRYGTERIFVEYDLLVFRTSGFVVRTDQPGILNRDQAIIERLMMIEVVKQAVTKNLECASIASLQSDEKLGGLFFSCTN